MLYDNLSGSFVIITYSIVLQLENFHMQE